MHFFVHPRYFIGSNTPPTYRTCGSRALLSREGGTPVSIKGIPNGSFQPYDNPLKTSKSCGPEYWLSSLPVCFAFVGSFIDSLQTNPPPTQLKSGDTSKGSVHGQPNLLLRSLGMTQPPHVQGQPVGCIASCPGTSKQAGRQPPAHGSRTRAAVIFNGGRLH